MNLRRSRWAIGLPLVALIALTGRVASAATSSSTPLIAPATGTISAPLAVTGECTASKATAPQMNTLLTAGVSLPAACAAAGGVQAGGS